VTMILSWFPADSQAKLTPSETAKQLHNPLSNLREVIFQLDVLPNVGPNNKTDWVETIQPVYPFDLPNDWFFITNWTIGADWEAPSGDQWTVPIGGGFGKQFKIGDHQFQAYGQLGYNVIRPDDEEATWRGVFALTWVF
jgi:hypothetical protein